MSGVSDGPPYNHPLSCQSSSDNDKYVYTWKISNISSIQHVVDYVVQSPPFFFNDATWILKLYPYGQTVFKSTGFVDIRIEQKGLKDDALCKIFCKNAFHNSKSREIWKSDAMWEIRNFMQNIKYCPEKWKIAPDDTLTLICELENRFESEKKSVHNPFAVRNLSGNKGNPEVGEIFEECFESKSYMWKICDIHDAPSPFPDTYKIQSGQFAFAGATWVLKVYPYFKMVTSHPSYDILLERVASEVSEHHIVLRIGASEQVERTLIFNACHAQGDRIKFLQKDVPKCLHISFVIRCRKSIGFGFHFQAKCMGTVNGSSMMLESSKALRDFKELYLKKEDCDVIIKVKGQEFPAHAVILKARSPVLASALRSDMKEKATGIVEIEDCDPSSFPDFLGFIYCGEIDLSAANVFSLFTTADKYDVQDLRAMCLEFMKQNVSVDNFCDTIALALLHSETELINVSTHFFTKNMQKIIVTVKWLSFITENPVQGNELMIKAVVK